ncbi:lipase family protein [Nocardia jiangxiensis]|uniref:lipase family protein n=1 Tax=Nocardia jiangxiensis TaxID=282685 RepID=UPI0003033AD8|nr:lipase family protein [Nocardia jiangxiensis]
MRWRGWGPMVMAAAIAVSAVWTTAAPADAAVPGNAIGVLPQADSWRGIAGGSILDYWMTGSDGTPQRASGALFVPPGRAPAGGWPIMAYDHGTSGLGAGCGGQTTATGSLGQQEDNRIVQYFLAKGFAVVAPDYLGLGRFRTGPHPYLELNTEATATIDLVRAARATHPALSRTWAVIGGSQGGQAALGTAHLQHTYAPDLDFRGTITVDPESDIEALLPVTGPWVPNLRGVSDTGTTTFIAMILAGLRATHPEVAVDSYLSPRGRDLVDGIGDLCLGAIMRRADGASIGDLLDRQLTTDAFRTALTSYMAVPTSGYDAPILLLTNITDTTVPGPLHATLAAQFAAGGVDFRTVVGRGSHCQLNPRMWSAISDFAARIQATPTRR